VATLTWPEAVTEEDQARRWRLSGRASASRPALRPTRAPSTNRSVAGRLPSAEIQASPSSIVEVAWAPTNTASTPRCLNGRATPRRASLATDRAVLTIGHARALVATWTRHASSWRSRAGDNRFGWNQNGSFTGVLNRGGRPSKRRSGQASENWHFVHIPICLIQKPTEPPHAIAPASSESDRGQVPATPSSW